MSKVRLMAASAALAAAAITGAALAGCTSASVPVAGTASTSAPSHSAVAAPTHTQTPATRAPATPAPAHTPAPSSQGPVRTQAPVAKPPVSQTPVASNTPASQPTAAPWCRAADLSIALGASDVATGSIYIPINFRNHSLDACRLGGYPGVSLLDSLGNVIGHTAVRTGVPQTFKLRHGDTVHSILRVDQVRNYSASKCNPSGGKYLAVIPPDSTSTTTLQVAGGIEGCTVNVYYMHLYPMAPGVA